MPTRISRTWTSVTSPKTCHEPRHPAPPYTPKKTPVISTILTTIPKFHSLTPPSSKQKQAPNEEFNYKTITPTSTNPTPATLQPTITTPSTSTLKKKLSKKLTNQKIISIIFPVTFTYLTYTPTTSSTNAHAFIHFSRYIPKNDCKTTGHHPTNIRINFYGPCM